MAEASVSVKDANSSALIPVDGVIVPSAAPNPTTGQSIRQGLAVGDGRGNLTFANVETVAMNPSDPAMFVRGIAAIEDMCVALKAMLNILATPTTLEPATGRTRVTLDMIGASAAAVSLTTVSAIPTLGGLDPKQTLLFANELQAWNSGVRACIV
jgi:hypothetical protein